MNADGSQARSFLKPQQVYQLYRPKWFPNGRRLLYLKPPLSPERINPELPAELEGVINKNGKRLRFSGGDEFKVKALQVKFHQENGKANAVLESRDLKGADPVVLLSNPHLESACWAQPGRMILSILEAPPNEKNSNLWEIRYDVDTGKPRGAARRLTEWPGFHFYDLKTTADGKRLVFMNLHSESDVYVGQLADSGATLKTPQRLTLDELWDWPTGWSQDSKAVFFYSDFGGGTFDVYRQALDQHMPDKITSGPDDKWAPQLSPDGKLILYVSWPKATNPSDIPPGKLMRVSPSGGPAEFVADIKGHPYVGTNQGGIPSFRCPVHAGADCVLAEKGEGKQTVFTAFDPNTGRKGEITTFSGDPDFVNWDLSPDGLAHRRRHLRLQNR
jgi:hypothetical protein